MKTTPARIAAIAVAAALGLTACGGDTHAADTQVTTPASAEATSPPRPPSPTSTAPPGKSAARAAQEAAAIALVRTYVDEYNKALQSGSTTDFRETFENTCAYCLAEATTIERTFRTKQQLRGLQYTVTSPVVTFNGVAHGGPQIWVEGQLSQAGGKVLAASGAVVHNVTPTPPFRVLWEVKPGASPVIVASENR